MAAPAQSASTAAIARPGTLKDLAYREIMGQLLSGQLQPDKLYSAQYFADRLGISRTPAREALLQLANMGFLVCLDVRGFKLKRYSNQEIRDVFEARRVIETYVLTRLVGRLSAEQLDQFQQNLACMNRCAARKDALGFLEADRQFHMLPVLLAGNQFLAGVMDGIRNHIAVLGIRALGHASRFREVIQEHAAILDALRAGRRQRAIRALDHHLATTRRYLLEQSPTAR